MISVMEGDKQVAGIPVITQKGHGMITTSSVSNFILKNIIKILITKVIN